VFIPSFGVYWSRLPVQLALSQRIFLGEKLDARRGRRILVVMDAVLTPANYIDIALRLVVALLLGAAVGFDREIQQKPAGLRTHALVALGAALLTIMGLLLDGGDAGGDAASRVLQGVVAGIGFIGGGVILHRGDKEVSGLTTAASIWVVAALGMACGAGLWRSALTTALLVLAVLALGDPLDRMIRRWQTRRRSE
jgi:putative Mg2+ transporter-C (MgtC) family protein